MKEWFELILSNKILITGLVAWCVSQVLKTLIVLIVHKEFRIERLFGDGGIPSSHSSTVTAVMVMTGIVEGWNSPLFAVAFFLAVIVMHDAMGVRLETGKQAKVINDLTDFIEAMVGQDLTPEDKLKELVGHTPLQVFSGFVLGLIIALLMAG